MVPVVGGGAIIVGCRYIRLEDVASRRPSRGDNITTLHKDVMSKCYGGDISGRKKLPEKR